MIFLDQEYSKQIFTGIISQTIRSHALDLPDDLNDSDLDLLNNPDLEIDDPCQCYAEIVGKLVQYSESQSRAIRIHQYSEINTVNEQIRSLELQAGSLSRDQLVTLHKLYLEARQLSIQQAKHSALSRQLNYDLQRGRRYKEILSVAKNA